MILDGLLLFDNNSAITASGVSANVLDLLNARDMAPGYDLPILVQPTANFAASGAGTLQIQVQGSADNSAWTTYAESAVLTLAQLTAGRNPFQIDLPSPNPGDPLPRYLRLNYLVGTGPMTAGTITAGIILDRQQNIAYRPGIVVAN
jgi:hypothetical protein